MKAHPASWALKQQDHVIGIPSEDITVTSQGISIHQQPKYLFNSLFKHKIEKQSSPLVMGLMTSIGPVMCNVQSSEQNLKTTCPLHK